jgi:hypothetical protein
MNITMGKISLRMIEDPDHHQRVVPVKAGSWEQGPPPSTNSIKSTWCINGPETLEHELVSRETLAATCFAIY